jgi:hypothetical protein
LLFRSSNALSALLVSMFQDLGASDIENNFARLSYVTQLDATRDFAPFLPEFATI